MHAAAVEYSRGLEVIWNIQDSISVERVPEPQSYLLMNRMHTYWCLAERATRGGEFTLSRQFYQRLLQDCRLVMRNLPDSYSGYVLASHALAKLGNPPRVSMALLMQGRQCEDNEDVKEMLAAYVRKGLNEADSSLLRQVMQNQQRWETSAQEDTAWLEEMTEDPQVKEMLSRDDSAEITTAPGSLHLQSEEELRKVYEPKFCDCLILACDDDELLEVEAEEARNYVSALKKGILDTFPQGLYGEMTCSEACCKHLVSSLQHSEEAVRRLELARRCNVIGNRETAACRPVSALQWYSRGLTLLLPER